MQAVIRRTICLLALGLGLATASAAQTGLGEIRPQARPAPVVQVLEALRTGDWAEARAMAAALGDVTPDLVEWHALQAGRGTFAELRAFLDIRPDWPGLRAMRRRNEDLVAGQADAEILRFFAEHPAQTIGGVLAHAGALTRAERSGEAEALLIQAWQGMRMDDADHRRILDAHGALLEPHHWTRLDAMLWRGWHGDALRMFDLVGDGRTKLARARIGLRGLSGNVDALIAEVPESLIDDPGLVHERFEWRMRKGRWDEAKEMIVEQSGSADALGWPQGWADRRAQLVRDELREGSAGRAYDMAARHHLSAGADFAELEWLAGYIALTRLDDAERALEHFGNHDSAVVTPISQGRAGYWKGRALRAMGRTAEADMEFARGAAHQTSFYGLLAAEAAGLPFDVGLGAVPQVDWRDSPLYADSLFRAGLMLVAAGERNLAERFWVHLAEQLGGHDAALLGQAAIDLGEPHLAVMIGKAVARRGVTVPVPYYPLHPLAEADLPVPAALALSIARRESEFDPVVISGAGARGLMQVMPGTAREVAGALGLGAEHSTERLTSDPVYNARLGTVYLAGLADQFDGNIVMISAGYNAGPARPARWMQLYGDPRGTDIETMIDWIENIPFSETRNYVMRVAESMPIFRARLGQDPLPVPFSAELLGRTVEPGG